MNRIFETANHNGIDVTTEIVIGHPAEQILLRAEHLKVDLVIVGQRGASNLEGIGLDQCRNVSWHTLHALYC